MIKPKRLKEGSRIAIISPSNGLPFLFSDIYELGLKNLREILGFELVEMKTARMSPEELYNNPRLRAEDINNAFKDESIDGIITSIGGCESVRILKYLDKDLIINNPKFIMGFSDATTFLTYLNQLGMITFYGPSVMAGFAQLENLPKSYINHIKAILFEGVIPYSYKPYEKWVDGYKDWNNKETIGQCTEFNDNKDGWKFLQGKEDAEGILWGGCIEVLEFLKSTDYWPSKDFWQDKVLFFETSEDKPSPSQVESMLRNYGIQGIFNKVKAIIFGRPKDYSKEEKEELNQSILRVVKDEFENSSMPIVVDVDFGHTDPKLILPIGARIKLNPDTSELILIEDPFQP
ncbi:S66 family peptidase [Clostridium sp. UBA6640]|uniref:S66 family peptidase n=1 Tax=Clostridium sp. UBA6640 TaxID=1946370 RepID=UPI0025BAA408|nr:S66 peptidase family protein [Clostridium sp. UBA6640]